MELYKTRILFEDTSKNLSQDSVFISSLSTDFFFQLRFKERTGRTMHDTGETEIFGNMLPNGKKLVKINIHDLMEDSQSNKRPILPELEKLMLDLLELPQLPLEGLLPNIQKYDSKDLEQLQTFLSANPQIFCHDYAMGLIAEENQNFPRAVKFYTQGIEQFEHGCSCKMLKYFLEPCELNDQSFPKAPENYDQAIDIFVKCIFNTGLFYITQTQDRRIVTLLESFYVY